MEYHRLTAIHPEDTSVSVNMPLVKWHTFAAEANGLFPLSGTKLSGVQERALDSKRSLTEVSLEAEMDGVPVRIEYGRYLSSFGDLQYKTASAFFAVAPEHAVRPVNWHVGRKGAYFVWEKVPGQSLRARILYGNPVSETEADGFAKDALDIADALENAGVVHRDIRPETLFIGASGSLKLTGFRFAVKSKTYSKEVPWLRKNPLGHLAVIGGDFALEPGRWNDAWSLAKCLELLPQTKTVTEARKTLLEKFRSGSATVSVRLPSKKRIAMFFAWFKFAISDTFGTNKRSKEKHKNRRIFARNAFLSCR